MTTFSFHRMKAGSAGHDAVSVGLGRWVMVGHLIALAAAVLSLCVAGCSTSTSNSSDAAKKLPLSGITLKIAVAGDPEMGAAIGRLQGEWNLQTGGEFQVLEIAEKDLGEWVSRDFPADAVICDPRFISIFGEQEKIASVPAWLQNSAEWADVFDLLRNQGVGWGGRAMAVPFGSPVFVVYYRADLVEKLNRRLPQTWGEYQELARLLASMKQPNPESPWSGTAEPLGPGWAGLTLLARAAPYAKHRDNYSTLFNIKTMEPLLTGPPMVRALEELAAAAKLGPPEALESDPAGVRAAFWQGRCGMAITWPTASDRNAGERAAAAGQPQVAVGFFDLPGSKKVYNINNQEWETRLDDEDTRVPLLNLRGRVGMVGKECGQQEAAFKLLAWLSGEQNSRQISAASPAATLYRHSQLKQPMVWVEKPVSPAAAAKYADLTSKTFRDEQWLGCNIPGREEYLAALDEAVRSVVRQGVSPADALEKAAASWREITEKRGVERQRSAYLHSLGLE
jgi:multiple sugar transport system substrate-binding protein